jgi:hypothetical protein
VLRKTATHDGRVIQAASIAYGLQLAEVLAIEITGPPRALLAGRDPAQCAVFATLADTLDADISSNVVMNPAKPS